MQDMHRHLLEKPIYQKIVYQAYFGRRGAADKLCEQAVDVGDITLDELVEVVERVGEHFLDAEKLVGDLTQ